MNKQDVINILSDPICNRINFTFQSVHGIPVAVSGESFRRVANGLRNNIIRFSNAIIPAGENVLARYFGDTNEFQLPRNISRLGHLKARSAVIHETVHASFDLSRSRITRLDDELAAFIAQYIYEILSSPDAAKKTSRPPNRIQRVCRSYLETNSFGSSDIQELRTSLERMPGYHKEVWARKCEYLMNIGNG